MQLSEHDLKQLETDNPLVTGGEIADVVVEVAPT
jgi:hypothetical protein